MSPIYGDDFSWYGGTGMGYKREFLWKTKAVREVIAAVRLVCALDTVQLT